MERVVSRLGRFVLVHGGATGADDLAAQWAERFGIEAEAHPAQWSIGRKAGPLRNAKMARLGAALCVAFPGNDGTADMIRKAKAAGIPVWEPAVSLELPSEVG